MVEEKTQDWRELCRAACTEKDTVKLLSMVSKVITILESEEARKRLARSIHRPGSANPEVPISRHGVSTSLKNLNQGRCDNRKGT
jgi:hypothetical protein